MLKTLLLKQSIKWILACMLPSPLKCFMYIFILIATLWASIAGYYYFSEDYIRGYGAFVSAGASGVAALIALMWDFYLNKRDFKENMLGEIVSKNYLLLKTVYDQLRKYYTGRNLKNETILFVSIFIVLYLFFRKKRGG